MNNNTRATLSASSAFSPSHSWEIKEALGNGIEGLRRHWKVLLPATFIVSFLGEGLSWALTSAGDPSEACNDTCDGGVCFVNTPGAEGPVFDTIQGAISDAACDPIRIAAGTYVEHLEAPR